MSEEKPSKRVKSITPEEMRTAANDLIEMCKRTLEAVGKLGDKSLRIDGWDSVPKSVNTIRKHFAKIIGEAGLRDLLYATDLENEDATNAPTEKELVRATRSAKTKPKRDDD